MAEQHNAVAQQAYSSGPSSAAQRRVLIVLFSLVACGLSATLYFAVAPAVGMAALVLMALLLWVFFARFFRIVSSVELREFLSIYYSGPMAKSIPVNMRIKWENVKNPTATVSDLISSAPDVAADMVGSSNWTEQEASQWKASIVAWISKTNPSGGNVRKTE